MMKRLELIDEIHTLYNEINRLQSLLDNALEKNSKQDLKVGKWVVDRYCSECEWDK